jgi:SET domain-containing protein
MDRWLARFQANNFVIARGGQPAGNGVFPCTAILNHSCAPNCEIVHGYEDSRSLAVVVKTVCSPGDELTHSYIDLRVEDAAGRRALLWKKYRFCCDVSARRHHHACAQNARLIICVHR